MPTVCTIGSQGKPLREFIERLRHAGVDAVIDVRLRNTSHLAGYTKRDDLAYLLREGFGLAYEHRPDLAPNADLLTAYRQNKDWPTYVATFCALLVERHAELVANEIIGRYRVPCLLCSEARPDKCHRRLVAEYWARRNPGLEIQHL